MLLELARPEQILSVSFLARDSALSVFAERARNIAPNRGSAEEILALKPDLVMADPSANQMAVALIRRAGIPIWQLDPPFDAASIQRETVRAGEALGAQAAAGLSVTEMQRRLDAAKARAVRGEVSAVTFYPNAWATGPGTLANAALGAAGLRNAIDKAGYSAFSLEGLIRLTPDYLVLPREQEPAFSQAAAALDHAAIRSRWPQERRIQIPGKLLICGGSFLAEAVERLVDATGPR